MSNLSEITVSEESDQTSISSLYFPVCLWKLVLMSICTFGIYEAYWFYKNWDFIKSRNRPRINRVFRSIFFPYIFNFSLFSDIYRSADSSYKCHVAEITFLSLSWFFICLTGFLGNPCALFRFLSFLPLLQVQKKINELNIKENKEFNRNCRLSAWNIVAVVIGGILILFTILGTFLELPNS